MPAPETSEEASISVKGSSGTSSRNRLFLEATRWGLMGALVAAPWAYGCTRPEPKMWLAGALLLLAGMFVASLIAVRRRPRIHPLAAGATVLLLAQGWIMTLNPKCFFDPARGVYYDLIHRIAWLPGTMDRPNSLSQMVFFTGLLGVFWICADLRQNPRWLQRLWTTMAFTGGSILLLGLAQHVTGAKAIFWEWGETTGKTFFATYRYHANAGAFVNLVLPLIAGRAYLAFHQGERSKVFWLLLAFIAAACVFLHASRAASVIGCLLLLGMIVWWLLHTLRRGGCFLRKVAFVLGSLAIVAALAWAFGYGQLEHAWFGKKSILENRRYLVYETISERMIPESGVWGFGPGTFHITFPFFTSHLGKALKGYWATAHQDYLQTLVEWGWIGGVLWMIVLPGALLRGVGKMLLFSGRGREGFLFQTAACFSLAGILLHAGVDFPLQIASLQLYVLCLAGVLWGLDERDRILSQETNWK